MLKLFDYTIHGPWITAGDDLQYRLEEKEEAIYLSFQGSVSDRDWKNNFDFFVKPYKKMPTTWYAHRGFVKLYKSARDEIITKYTALNSSKPVIISGYSQGAALAVLAHEDFKFSYPMIDVKTYAFAPPRVLWMPKKVIKDRFKDVTLVIRRGDLVTHIPFYIMGFLHCGVKKIIGNRVMIWWTHHLQNEYEQFLKDM